MAGWTQLPATNETDLTAWSFRKQFWEAILERRVADGDYYGRSVPEYSISERLDGWASAPPSAPSSGDRWAVLPTATGDWAGHDNRVAQWGGAAWSYETPADGTFVACEPSGQVLQFTGGAWLACAAQARDTSSLEDIRSMQGQTTGLAGSANPPFIPNNVSNDYAGLTTVPAKWDPDDFFTAIGIPPGGLPGGWGYLLNSGGWTRKYPRQIAKLTDSGESGQRARLVGHTTTGLYPFGDVRTIPPSRPPVGRYYGVAASATGDWVGHDGELARWTGSAWTFTTPASGAQYLFPRGSGAAVLPHSRPWQSFDDGWHRVCDIYAHDGTKWQRSGDQASGPDIVTAYGNAQEGDLLGPWLFNEIAAGLNLLTRRATAYCHRGGDMVYHATEAHSHLGEPDTWAEAKAEAEAFWADEVPGTVQTQTWERVGWSLNIHAWNKGTVDEYEGEDYYDAKLNRRSAQIRGAFDSNYDSRADRTVAVDIYVIGDKIYSDWDFEDFGDGVNDGTSTLFKAWSATASGGYYESEMFSDGDDPPNHPWCPTPTHPHGDGSEIGYEIVDAFCIEDSAVVGGFTYY